MTPQNVPWLLFPYRPETRMESVATRTGCSVVVLRALFGLRADGSEDESFIDRLQKQIALGSLPCFCPACQFSEQLVPKRSAGA